MRVDALARGLEALGVKQGDRVATFMWNSQPHLELYMAAPCMGAVLHTLNIRLFEEQLTYIVNHARGQGRSSSTTRSCRCSRRSRRRSSVEQYVVVGDGDAGTLPEAIALRGPAAAQDAGPTTTRSSTSATAAASATRAARPATRRASSTRTARTSSTRWRRDDRRRSGLAARDRVLPVVPMFHANAWGLPYAAALAGADWSCRAASSTPSRWRS